MQGFNKIASPLISMLKIINNSSKNLLMLVNILEKDKMIELGISDELNKDLSKY